MSTVTATPDAGNSWARLDIDYSDTIATQLQVLRNNPDGSQAQVRAGTFTTSLTLVPSNSNQTFESATVAGWSTTTGITFAADNTQARVGVWSMKLTPNGATATPFMESDRFAVRPTQRVIADVWLFSLVGYTTGMSVSVRWYDATNTLISTTTVYPGGAVALPVGVWTEYGSLLTGIYPQAPANTASASITINYAGTPAATVIVWTDTDRATQYPVPAPLVPGVYLNLVGGKITLYDVELPLDQPVTYTVTAYTDQGALVSGSQTYDLGVPVGTTITTGQVIVSSGGYLWLKDPAIPANSIQVGLNVPGLNLHARGPGVAALSAQPAFFQGMDALKRPANSASFNVNNSARPVVVSKARSSAQSQLFLLTRTFADAARLDQLLDAGGPLLLQAPAVYGMPDRYLLLGDSTQSRIGQDHRYPVRALALPWVHVDAPPGAPQGVAGARWADYCNHAASWGALTAQNGGGTWDTFTRTVGSGGWGTGDGGSVWTVAGTPADMSVAGGVGLMAISVVATNDEAFTFPTANIEQRIDVFIPVVATGAGIQAMIEQRRVDASNGYRMGIQFNTGGTTTIMAIKRSGAADTTLNSVAGANYSAGQWWRIHCTLNGTAFSVSAWPRDTAVEPLVAQVTATDATFAASNPSGPFGRLVTANTNALPVTLQWDNYRVLIPASTWTWTQLLDRAAA
jgi:hypothetical protein